MTIEWLGVAIALLLIGLVMISNGSWGLSVASIPFILGGVSLGITFWPWGVNPTFRIVFLTALVLAWGVQLLRYEGWLPKLIGMIGIVIAGFAFYYIYTSNTFPGLEFLGIGIDGMMDVLENARKGYEAVR